MNATQYQLAQARMIDRPRTPADEIRTQAILHAEYRRLVAKQMATRLMRTNPTR